MWDSPDPIRPPSPGISMRALQAQDVCNQDLHQLNLSLSTHLTNTFVMSAFATFHESAINNVTSILQSEGKICGKNVLPHSE